jgi:hypothetical protein
VVWVTKRQYKNACEKFEFFSNNYSQTIVQAICRQFPKKLLVVANILLSDLKM